MTQFSAVSPLNPAIQLLGCPREIKTYIYKKTCTRMFLVALFITEKKNQMPNNRKMDKEMVVYAYKGTLLSKNIKTGNELLHATIWASFIIMGS